MRLFGNLLKGRTRGSSQSDPGSARPPGRIRSLDDLDGHFPWPDIGTSCMARTEIRNPLAVALRTLRVVGYTVGTAEEMNMDDRDAGGMTLLGLSGALHALAQHGEWDAVGTLLNTLEYLISPRDRPFWLDGLDPYKETED